MRLKKKATISAQNNNRWWLWVPAQGRDDKEKESKRPLDRAAVSIFQRLKDAQA